MSRFSLFLLLSACGADPREAPEMEPPITGELVVKASEAAGPLGGPIELPVHFEGPGVYGSRRVVSQQGWADGRGRYDDWTVSPSDGVTDPSVFWEDQLKAEHRDHVVLTPAKPVDLKIRLHESVRFPRPGTYAVQLATSRGEDLVRSEPVLVKVGAGGDLDARARTLLEKIEASSGKEQTQAFVDLAMLGAPSAVDVAVGKLGHPNQGSRWSLVLHAHPDRAGVRSKLEAVVASPTEAVPTPLIETLTALCYNDRYAWPIPQPGNTQADQARFQLERKVRDAAATECREEAAATVAAGAPGKKGEARGVTMATLLRHRALYGGDPTWGPQIATEAARSIEDVDDKVLRAWLTKDLYRRNLDEEAMVEPLERLALEASVKGDLALDALYRVVPAKALTLAAGRFALPKPLASAEAAWILEASSPRPADVDALIAAVGPADLTHLRLAARFAEPRHAARWAELYGQLPEDVKTPLLGTVVAGLMNTGHPLSKTGLDRYGPDHPQLLVEVAKSVRDARPLVERAFLGVQSPDFEVSHGAAIVLAEHMVASDKDRLLRVGKQVDGKGEFGVAFAFATARAWTGTFEEIDALGRTMKADIATSFLETQVFRSKPVIVLRASEVRHQPAIELNGQMYVGEAQIVAKLKQLDPPKGVKFGFSGLDATENLPRFMGYAKAAGLTIFEDE